VLNPWAESARLGDWWGTAFSLPLESQIEWNQARQRAVILRTPKEFLEGADPRDLRKYQRLGAAGEKACHVVLEMPGKMAETLWFAGENAMLAAGGARVVAGGARLAAGSGRAIIGGAGRGLASRGLPRLHWHGSRPAVERAYAQGLFAHGPGSGGKYWATTLSARGKLTDLLIGGTQNVDSLIPLRLSSKGAFEAVYALTPQEAAQFSRAWGFTYSWNPYQWYKGSLFGQYYYQAVPVTWGQRGTELGRATIITGAVAGGTVGADYLIQQK